MNIGARSLDVCVNRYEVTASWECGDPGRLFVGAQGRPGWPRSQSSVASDVTLSITRTDPTPPISDPCAREAGRLARQ
jgi:hypothetical protein